MYNIFYSQTNNFSRKLEIYLSCRICHKLTIFIKTLHSINFKKYILVADIRKLRYYIKIDIYIYL